MPCAAPVVIRRGLPLRLRHDAARLIGAGFGGQIAPGLGRRAGAARIRRGLRRGRVIVALDASGALVGLTGLAGVAGRRGRACAAAGRRARRRVAQRVVALMARPLVGATEDLVLDCLIVAPRWRGLRCRRRPDPRRAGRGRAPGPPRSCGPRSRAATRPALRAYARAGSDRAATAGAPARAPCAARWRAAAEPFQKIGHEVPVKIPEVCASSVNARPDRVSASAASRSSSSSGASRVNVRSYWRRK